MKRPPKPSSPDLTRPDLLANEDVPAAPQQARSRRTRDALLSAALDLFAARGFERTSIADIANGANAAAGTFYQHFRSKRQLLLVLMDGLLREIEALNLSLDSGEPRAVLETALRQGLSADRAYAGAYRAWREVALSDADVAALDAQVQAWTAKRVAFALRSALAFPGARREVDVETTARLLNGLFWRVAEESADEDERTIQAVLHLFMHGLFEDEALT